MSTQSCATRYQIIQLLRQQSSWDHTSAPGSQTPLSAEPTANKIRYPASKSQAKETQDKWTAGVGYDSNIQHSASSGPSQQTDTYTPGLDIDIKHRLLWQLATWQNHNQAQRTTAPFDPVFFSANQNKADFAGETKTTVNGLLFSVTRLLCRGNVLEGRLTLSTAFLCSNNMHFCSVGIPAKSALSASHPARRIVYLNRTTTFLTRPTLN